MAVHRRPFKGKHMAAILVVGFGVVAAVNFFMASHAVGGFHGIVVENSYVASQKFNSYLEQAEVSRALGWEAKASRDEAGHVVLNTYEVPEGALVTARLRRPIGTQELAELSFLPTGKDQYRSNKPVAHGRWTMRLTITSGQDTWVEEGEL